MHLPVDGPKLGIDKPSLIRNGESDLRSSPSGGVMLVGPCSSDDQGEACVRQPDGRWATIHGDVDVSERGAGPLADGRMVFLRGIYEGDEPHGDDTGPEAKPGARKPYVAVVDPSGKESIFAPPGFGSELRGDLRLAGHLEEETDHTVRF